MPDEFPSGIDRMGDDVPRSTDTIDIARGCIREAEEKEILHLDSTLPVFQELAVPYEGGRTTT